MLETTANGPTDTVTTIVRVLPNRMYLIMMINVEKKITMQSRTRGEKTIIKGYTHHGEMDEGGGHRPRLSHAQCRRRIRHKTFFATVGTAYNLIRFFFLLFFIPFFYGFFFSHSSAPRNGRFRTDYYYHLLYTYINTNIIYIYIIIIIWCPTEAIFRELITDTYSVRTRSDLSRRPGPLARIIYYDIIIVYPTHRVKVSHQ